MGSIPHTFLEKNLYFKTFKKGAGAAEKYYKVTHFIDSQFLYKSVFVLTSHLYMSTSKEVTILSNFLMFFNSCFIPNSK